MASAIWSSSLATIDRFPVRNLVRFMDNHGMLAIGAHPTWRVVRGGSHSYIPRLIAPLGEAVHLGVHLRSVLRDDAGVTLTFADRPAQRVDEVVFACAGNQVLPLLADASDIERDVFRHVHDDSERGLAAHRRELLPRRHGRARPGTTGSGRRRMRRRPSPTI